MKRAALLTVGFCASMSLNLGCGADGGSSPETSRAQNAGSVGGAGGTGGASPVECRATSGGGAAGKLPDSAIPYSYGTGMTSCIEIAPGDYHPQWAHGSPEQWKWQSLKDNSKDKNDLTTAANTEYVLAYDSSGEISISQSQNCSLNGNAKVCVANEGREKVYLGFCNGYPVDGPGQPYANSGPGRYPNYYGPYAPTAGGHDVCENLMAPGVFNVIWAHGPYESWNWMYLEDPIDMRSNQEFVMTYVSGEDPIVKARTNFCLAGMTRLCFRDEASDELVVSLEIEE